MDEYNVPVTDRPKWFKFHVFGGWGAAGIMFAFLLRCLLSSADAERKHAKDSAEREFTIRSQVRAEIKEDFQYVLRMMEEKDKAISALTDSLKRRL